MVWSSRKVRVLVGPRGVIIRHLLPRPVPRKSGLGAGRIWLQLGKRAVLVQRGAQESGQGVEQSGGVE